MFDIGFSEMLVIAVVALIVIGPERLPKVARTLGHLFGRMQRYVNDVKADISREMELDELRKLQTTIQRRGAVVRAIGEKRSERDRIPIPEDRAGSKSRGVRIGRFTAGRSGDGCGNPAGGSRAGSAHPAQVHVPAHLAPAEMHATGRLTPAEVAARSRPALPGRGERAGSAHTG